MDDLMDGIRFADIIQRLRDIAPQAFSGPVSTETIKEAEAELGLEFPERYVQFLRELGGADFPLDIYGLEPIKATANGSSPWNVSYVTQSERDEVLPAMPRHLIPLRPDCMGNHWCLDTSHMSGSECPVVFWNHDAGENQVPLKTHNAFMDFLENALNNEEEQSKTPS